MLLTAPVDVLLARIEGRPLGRFGSTAEHRRKVAADAAQVEPLLRASATHVLDGRQPPAAVVDRLQAVADGAARSRPS